jgi:hypothetical protein
VTIQFIYGTNERMDIIFRLCIGHVRMHSFSVVVVDELHLDSPSVFEATAKVTAAAEEVETTKFGYVMWTGVEALSQRGREG